MLQYIKFGQNPSFGSRDTVQTRLIFTALQYMKFGQNPSFGSRDRVQTNVFGQKLKILKCWFDLENEVKVTKILSLLSSLPIMCLCKSGQKPHIGSRDRVQRMSNVDAGKLKSADVTLKMRSRSPKPNQFFPPSQ